MSVRRTIARSLGVLALTTPIAASLLALGATSALADGSYTSPTPADGAVLSTNDFTVQVSVTAGSSDVTLDVTGRAAGSTFCSASVLSSGNALSGARSVKLTFPGSSGGCATSRNGQWTAVLSGGANGTRSFTTNAAPATPSGFSAQGSGARDVSFSWSRGSEGDITGYVLYDGSGNVIDGAGDIPMSRCSGNSCSYALYYPADNGGTHTYQLAAKRASGGCSSCGSSLTSASKASATATLVDPKPTPSPTPSPDAAPTSSPDPGSSPAGTTSGSSPGSSPPTGSRPGGSSAGGSSTGGSNSGTAVNPGPKPTLPSLADPIVAARHAFALQFNAFSPSLGIPKLPPLPALTAPTFGEAPLPTGTYKPTLPYAPVTSTEKTTSVLSQPIAAVRDVLDSAQLAKSIAVAFLLLMAGAHLRRFIGTHIDE